MLGCFNPILGKIWTNPPHICPYFTQNWVKTTQHFLECRLCQLSLGKKFKCRVDPEHILRLSVYSTHAGSVSYLISQFWQHLSPHQDCVCARFADLSDRFAVDVKFIFTTRVRCFNISVIRLSFPSDLGIRYTGRVMFRGRDKVKTMFSDRNVSYVAKITAL